MFCRFSRQQFKFPAIDAELNVLQRPAIECRAPCAATAQRRPALQAVVALACMPNAAQAAVAAAPSAAWLAGLQWLPRIALLLLLTLLAAHALRQAGLTLGRLFGARPQAWAGLVSADWPTVTVLVAAHNQAAAVDTCLRALLASDYPPQRLLLMPVNDRSTDRTRAAIDACAALHPERVWPFHRVSGGHGSADALDDALALVGTDFALVLDAAHQPSPGLIKRMIAPFADAEVGAVVGRTLLQTAPERLQCRLASLENAGAGLNARRFGNRLGWNVGGVDAPYGLRLTALRATAADGGQRLSVGAADFGLRLLCSGWRMVYASRAECAAMPPPRDAAWSAQQFRSASLAGHRALARQWLALWRAPGLSVVQRLGGLLQALEYLVPLLLLAAGALTLLCYLTLPIDASAALLVLVVAIGHGKPGGFASFFDLSAAAHLDRAGRRVRLVAFGWMGGFGRAVEQLHALLFPAASAPSTSPAESGLDTPASTTPAHPSVR